MLEEQTLGIDFGQGIETKTDPKLVVAGKLLRLENMVFTSKSLDKRNGYEVINPQVAPGTLLSPSLISPKLIHALEDELLVADQGKLLSYSESQDAWINKGECNSIELTRSVVNSDTVASGYNDSAVLGNYAIYGWSTPIRQDRTPYYYSKVYVSVVDLQTNVALQVSPDQGLLSTNTSAEVNPVRCVVLGNAKLAILYTDPGSTTIKISIASINVGGGVTFTTSNISTNYTGGSFDVVATSTGAAIFYCSTGGLTVSTIDTTGAVVNTATIADVFAFPILSINENNGNFWLYWAYVDSGTPSYRMYYAVYDSSCAVVLARTLVLTGMTNPPTNMISVRFSNTQQVLYYGMVNLGSGSTIDQTYSVTTDDAGIVGTPVLFSFGVLPYSRSINVTTFSTANDYAIFVYRGYGIAGGAFGPWGGGFGQLKQPTFFLVKITNPSTLGTPTVVGRFAAGVARSQVLRPLEVDCYVGYTPNLSAITATQILFACAVETQEFLTDFFETAGASANGPGAISSAYSYVFDFDSYNAYRAVNACGSTVINGALMQAYDGKSCTELGFHLFPEIVLGPAGGGSMAPGLYSYLAIFQWYDDQGNLHQSAPSVPVAINLVGPSNSVNITVPNPFLTQKQNVNVAIYRTTASGTVYYLVTDPVFVTTFTPSTQGWIVYNDVISDANLTGNPQAYTYPASAVLENSTPPPSMAMAAHTNRLWFVDAENRNTIWYTKSKQDLVGISPSSFLTEQIDAKYGEIVSLSEIDEKLVMLKESGIFVQSGDGSSDTGDNNTLSFPQFVPSDVGCDQLKSVLAYPGGVIFHSPNGVYRLNRSMIVEYIGAEIEAYNSELITSGNMVKGKSQLRLLASSGLSFVYDYIMGQWSTFTNHTGLSATIWKSKYAYVRNNGELYLETPGQYLDDASAFSALLQFSWMHLGSIQGFQRVRRMIMLGNFISGSTAGHGVQIEAGYDFVDSFSTPVPFYFSGSSGVYQYRERLPRQKCDTISLRIQEITTGDAAEYVRFTSMGFEAAVKKGVNKLAASNTVG